MFESYSTLKGNKILVGPIKTILANIMMEKTKSDAMKTIGLSPKLAANFEKSVFNKDGTPKVKAINEINIKSIGVKEFGSLVPSGETLMEKWKKLQKIK